MEFDVLMTKALAQDGIGSIIGEKCMPNTRRTRTPIRSDLATNVTSLKIIENDSKTEHLVLNDLKYRRVTVDQK